MRNILLVVLLLFVAPVVVSTVAYLIRNRGVEWRSADRSSAGLLPPAPQHHDAVVRILSARTVSWRGIVATHSWIVVKEAGAPVYQRFDYTRLGLADRGRQVRP